MITILCGKSASGKDTLQEELKKEGFGNIVSTTSRPIRDGELNGREYNFTTKEQFLADIEAGKFLEYRTYNTLVGGKADTWYYGCPKKTLDDLDPNKDYVIILDMGGTKDFVDYYGKDNCFVCYVTVDEDLRKERAMSRGSFDETEWNRRAKDDEFKFAPDIVNSLANAQITNNTDSVDNLKEAFHKAYGDYKENLNEMLDINKEDYE